MKRTAIRILALLLVLAAMLSMTACGGNGAGSDTTFTFWAYNGIDSAYYMSYAENPALQYTLEKTYGPEEKQLAFEFWIPPAGTAVDNYSVMISTGDYADIIQNTIGDTQLNSYLNGISLDLTEYVENYMPNYLAYIEAHPEVRSDAVTLVDGEEKYLGILAFNEDYPAMDWGHEYRRDWIVKYGKNPETGAAFTGGYTDENDPDSWVDDVVFPSGGSDPVYISDWEWMFEIFQVAMADLGITDGYCYSIPYNGFMGMGELNAAFGGGATGYWYRNLDNEVVFGPATDQFRAYLQCVNTWYEKGWLDQTFNERASDMFYAIDSTTVNQGKVGMWYGLQGQLGRRMDTGDALTSGICVYGAPTPINDIYGGEESKFVEPYCGFGGSLVATTYLITVSAKDKDLATLCSYLDSFYTEEGAKIKTVGLTAEQEAEIDSDFYESYGLTNGSYQVTAEGKYQYDQLIRDDSGNLLGASTLSLMPGICLRSSIDYGYADTYQHSLDMWSKYDNIGFFQGSSMLNNMTEDDTDIYNNVATKVGNYMMEEVPKFVMGDLDPFNDTDWQNWITMMNKYGYQKLNDVAQKYADLYPLVLTED